MIEDAIHDSAFAGEITFPSAGVRADLAECAFTDTS